METGKIVRIFNHGYNMQVLCEDDQRLLSIYFEYEHFSSFCKKINKAGLKLNGLLINFDRNIVTVPSLGKRGEYLLTR